MELNSLHFTSFYKIHLINLYNTCIYIYTQLYFIRILIVYIQACAHYWQQGLHCGGGKHVVTQNVELALRGMKTNNRIILHTHRFSVDTRTAGVERGLFKIPI